MCDKVVSIKKKSRIFRSSLIMIEKIRPQRGYAFFNTVCMVRFLTKLKIKKLLR